MNYTILRSNYIESFYYDFISEQNKIVEHIHNTLKVPCEKSKTVSLHSSIMKNIVVLTFIFGSSAFCLFIFPVRLTCCIVFGSASSACCLHKSIVIVLCY